MQFKGLVIQRFKTSSIDVDIIFSRSVIENKKRNITLFQYFHSKYLGACLRFHSLYQDRIITEVFKSCKSHLRMYVGNNQVCVCNRNLSKNQDVAGKLYCNPTYILLNFHLLNTESHLQGKKPNRSSSERGECVDKKGMHPSIKQTNKSLFMAILFI